MIPTFRSPAFRALLTSREGLSQSLPAQEDSHTMLIPILVALLVAFASMQLSSLCTTIYLHRTMAHKG